MQSKPKCRSLNFRLAPPHNPRSVAVPNFLPPNRLFLIGHSLAGINQNPAATPVYCVSRPCPAMPSWHAGGSRNANSHSRGAASSLPQQFPVPPLNCMFKMPKASQAACRRSNAAPVNLRIDPEAGRNVRGADESADCGTPRERLPIPNKAPLVVADNHSRRRLLFHSPTAEFRR